MKTTPDKILLFSFDYPPNDGGISRFCASLAAALADRVERLEVLTQDAKGDGGRSNRPGIPIYRIVGFRPLRELAALRRIMKRAKQATVVSGIWYPEGLIAAIVGASPLVILVHGSELMPTPQLWRRALWRNLARWVLTRADLVVANSSYTQGLVQEIAPKSRSVAIPLGVDINEFSPRGQESAKARLGVSDCVVVSTVARLVRYKGHDLVMKVMAGLEPSYREKLVFLVAGDGPDRDWFNDLSLKLGLGSMVRWMGYLPDSELPDFYSASDLFVLCTRENPERQEVEGFGLAFLEAQACGTPVVGTRTGGIPDAVQHGVGGWLIEQDDHKALGEILCRLVDDPQSFREAGKAARTRVEEECTWDRFAESFVREIQISGPPSE